MALAVEFAKRGNRRGLLLFYAITALLGLAFLGIEGFEYREKFVEHLVPGAGFHFPGDHPPEVQMFYCLYFFMTGFHGLHMTIGVILIIGFGLWAWRSDHALQRPNLFEVLGLYWAFVDIVWMFLYPLFYLVHP
jgi:cytochrome c oxidase subunit 3